MNPQDDDVITGKLGELLVQLRLLEKNIEAAPPLTDSGNDLIALKSNVVKTIQVKTSRNSRMKTDNKGRKFDILALVRLVKDKFGNLALDHSKIYLLEPKEGREKASFSESELEERGFSFAKRLNSFFPEN